MNFFFLFKQHKLLNNTTNFFHDSNNMVSLIVVFFIFLPIFIGFCFFVYKFLIFPGVLNNNILLIIIGIFLVGPIFGLIFYLIARNKMNKLLIEEEKQELADKLENK